MKIIALLLVMPVYSLAQFIPQQDQIVSPMGGLVLGSTCNSSWFAGTQSRCYALQTAPSNVMWCHCQFKCWGIDAPLDADYKLWWSMPAGQTGQGTVFSKNANLLGGVYGTLTLFCGLEPVTKAGQSEAFCTDGKVKTFPFTLNCDAGGGPI